MNRCRALSLACSLLLAAPLALAQNPGMPGPPDGPRRGDMRGGGPEGRHGMGMLLHGMWWKNPDIIKLLNITPEQQKQLDKILLDSRVQLIQMHAALEQEQLKLEPLLNGTSFDERRAFAQISHIADLRADLEKTDAHMLLSLRGVLSADQWTKLQTERHSGHMGEGSDGQNSRGAHNWHRGPGPQGGPDAPNGPPPPPPGQNNE